MASPSVRTCTSRDSSRRRCSGRGNTSEPPTGAEEELEPAISAATRLQRRSTSSAFHGDQAAEPVAIESASVSAHSSASRSGVPTSRATNSMVAEASRSRRVATSASSRWCRTSATTVATSASEKPIRRVIPPASSAPTTEWSPCCGYALPRSCRRAATTSRSGRRHPVLEAGGLRRSLEQVAVHGEAVVRVALRPALRRLPLGQQPTQAPAVEDLGDRDLGSPHSSSSQKCCRADSGHGSGGAEAAARASRVAWSMRTSSRAARWATPAPGTGPAPVRPGAPGRPGPPAGPARRPPGARGGTGRRGSR